MLVVEVGIKLKNTLEYYDDLLSKNGFENYFNIETHDMYYTNKKLDGLSENEMKDSCIRLRSFDDEVYKVQNNFIDELDLEVVKMEELKEFEEKLMLNGYEKVFDTRKQDHHYKNGENKIQLQEIEDIGLLVYYDNSKYYELPFDEQRQKLMDDLHSFGFNEFDSNTMGLDKLKTLYYKKDCYSLNQNG